MKITEITCAMCGKATIYKDQERRIVEVIDGTLYNFDTCVLMLKNSGMCMETLSKFSA
jgi:hypothetical protein